MTDQERTRIDGDPVGTEPRPSTADTTTTAAGGTDGAPARTEVVDGGGSRRSARRWGIALIVVALVVGVAAAGVFLLAGGSTPSAVAGYAPRDAVTYMDARLDLPGDQRQKVGELLSKFPGFADQSTLESKIDEVLDRLVSEATDGEQQYTSDIKSWFGGEIGFAVGRLPDPPSGDSTELDTGEMLALVSVTDEAAARAWFEETADGSTSAETYNGVELQVTEDGDGAMAIVDGRVMLLGHEAAVKAAIDRGGENGLDTNEQFTTAMDATTGASVANFYIDLAAYLAYAEANADQMGEGIPTLSTFGFDADDVPPWVAGRVRAESDALVVEVVSPKAANTSDRSNRLSAIADNLPADTLFAADIHDVGVALEDLVEEFRSNPETAEAFREIESGVALLGGFDGLIGWIGDAAIVVTGSGSDVTGGLVLSATDAAGAERFSQTLRGILALGGAQFGIETREDVYNGTSITFLDVGALASGMAGVDGEIPEIGWAVIDDVLVLGVGEDFLHAVIDTTPDTSLASNDRYEALIDRVGSENFGSLWVDAVGLRAVFESIAEEEGGLAEYESDLKPYLEPFDAVVGASVVGDEYDRSTMILSVR